MALAEHWLDRVTAPFAPLWTLRRQRARVAGALLHRHYEASAVGRRTQGWMRATATDANAALGGLARLREVARDLVRNNPYAESALATIVDHAVGSWGIVAKPVKTSGTAAARNMAAARWTAWADTTACDADGQRDFAGLQKLVMRTVVESGEVLVRRRWRLPEDGLPIPLQLQVLEPDYLDTSRDTTPTPGGGRVIQGIEFDAIGRRRGYWLFSEHPGAAFTGGLSPSRFIPAAEILHIGRMDRPGQVRGVSWFAPVILRLKDFDEYEDAALMKQKVAACLAVITSDLDGTSSPLGTSTATEPTVDTLGPGMIINAAAGRSISVVDPPQVSEHEAYSKTVLRAIAAGLGVTYEDLTGDYAGMPFSAARMSRIRHWARVEDWRWQMLIPQFCDPAWAWAMQAARVGGMDIDAPPAVEWTCPPPPMIDPEAEGRAYMVALRIGAKSWPEMQRELGYDPEAVLAEIATWQQKMAKAGVILDGDPSVTTQAGLPRQAAASPAPAPIPNGNGART